MIPRNNECNCVISISAILISGSWHWQSPEVIERARNFYLVTTDGDEVLEQEKINVTTEITEELEEVGISLERVTQWALFGIVVSANTLQCQVEPIFDSWMAPARPVDRHLAVNLIAREHHHSADCVANCAESIDFRFRYQSFDLKILSE
jgi:hypothetical protein